MRLIGASAILFGFATAEIGYRVRSNSLQFLRVRRKNSGFFEESRDDNQERECHEEMCSKEELSEVLDNNADAIDTKWKELTQRCYVDRCDARGTQVCIQTWNKRECSCKTGFDGETCAEDIDECANKEIKKCDSTQKCKNTIGSYECVCDNGYVDNAGKCDDIDECADDTACGEHATCTNVPGTFTCDCNEGYEMNGENQCVDTNECADEPNPCIAPSVCNNIDGGYECICGAGMKMGASGLCEDIDECIEENPDCGNGSCTNILDGGGYKCVCDIGHENTNGEDKGKCVDIDECADPATCELGQTCHNYHGGSRCCDAGQDFDANLNVCINTDPCEGVKCNANSKCVEGSCLCNTGYTQDIFSDEGILPINVEDGSGGDGSGSLGALFCIDINECQAVVNPCGPEELCVNTQGSHNCVPKPQDPCDLVDCGVGSCQAGFCNCPAGYKNSVDDKGCEKVVTTTESPPDSPDAPVNPCEAGFEWDGSSCVDSDECQFNNGGCPDMCMNYWGTKRCYGSLSDERSMCHHKDSASSECQCFNGYKLCNDMFSCVTEDGYDEYDHRQNFKHEENTSSACSAGQIGVSGTCYSVSEDTATYQGAIKACQNEGGKLVVLQSRLAWWAIGNNVNHGTSPFWVNSSCKVNLLKMWVTGKGAALLANPASNMNNVPPQLNRASGAEQHHYVCQF